MRQTFLFAKLVFCVCLVLGIAVVVSGCETCKGLKRDIEKTDEWMQDNLW